MQNTCVYPEVISHIGNLRQEAEWTADKLIEYGYKDGYITLAFAKYNAPYKPNMSYAEKVKKDREVVRNIYPL